MGIVEHLVLDGQVSEDFVLLFEFLQGFGLIEFHLLEACIEGDHLTGFGGVSFEGLFLPQFEVRLLGGKSALISVA